MSYINSEILKTRMQSTPLSNQCCEISDKRDEITLNRTFAKLSDAVERNSSTPLTFFSRRLLCKIVALYTFPSLIS